MKVLISIFDNNLNWIESVELSDATAEHNIIGTVLDSVIRGRIDTVYQKDSPHA